MSASGICGKRKKKKKKKKKKNNNNNNKKIFREVDSGEII